MPAFLAALIMLPVIAGARFLIFLRNVATRWRRYVLPLTSYGKIILTLIRMRRRHGRAAGPTTAPPPGAPPRLMHSNATYRGWANIRNARTGLTCVTVPLQVHPRGVGWGLGSQGGQPRNQLRRRDAEDGLSLAIGEFRAGLDVLAAGDGQVAAQVGVVRAEDDAVDPDDLAEHTQ